MPMFLIPRRSLHANIQALPRHLHARASLSHGPAAKMAVMIVSHVRVTADVW